VLAQLRAVGGLPVRVQDLVQQVQHLPRRRLQLLLGHRQQRSRPPTAGRPRSALVVAVLPFLFLLLARGREAALPRPRPAADDDGVLLPRVARHAQPHHVRH
jgi:hypothetical protein